MTLNHITFKAEPSSLLYNAFYTSDFKVVSFEFKYSSILKNSNFKSHRRANPIQEPFWCVEKEIKVFVYDLPGNLKFLIGLSVGSGLCGSLIDGLHRAVMHHNTILTFGFGVI